MNNATRCQNSTNCISFGRPIVSYFERIPRDQHYDNFLLLFIIINAVVSVVVTCSNFIVIYTIARTASLRTPSNILILGLAIADVGGGLFTQPSYCAFKLSDLQRDVELFHLTATIFNSFIWTFGPVSFNTLMVITADRFLAVHLHLRYQELVTVKRYVLILLVIWGLSCISSVCKLVLYSPTVLVLAIVYCSCLLLLALYFLIKISQVIRRHSVQIQAQQQSVQQSIDMPRYKKSVNTMYYVIGAFVVSYVPFLGTMIAHAVRHKMTLELLYSYTVAETFVMFNGVLNPIIYCWRIEEIRNAADRLLRRIWKRSENQTV